MRYYKTILKYGHIGTGKSHDIARYIQAQDMLHALSLIRTMPILKTKNLNSIPCITEITEKEYRKNTENNALKKKIRNFGDLHYVNYIHRKNNKKELTLQM